MQSLPFDDSPAFAFDITLDAVSYRLAFLWNDRCSLWTLSVSDFNRAPIAQGIRIASGPDLFAASRSRGLPAGALFCTMTPGANRDPLRDDFKNGVAELIYIPEAELNVVAIG